MQTQQLDRKQLLSFLAMTLVVTVFFAISKPAKADLIDRGRGLIYDTDQNITWLQDANYAQTSSYHTSGDLLNSEAHAFIEHLNSISYLGYSDWRLPKANIPCQGYDCTTSEMGSLYYTGLGNTSAALSTNGGLFNNLCLLCNYWMEQVPPGDANTFVFSYGQQVFSGTADTYPNPNGGPPYGGNTYRVMVVRDGDVPRLFEPDGTINNVTGGTVTDLVFGDAAQITVPPDLLTIDTQASVNVYSADLQLPLPSGTTGIGTNFVEFSLTPEPAYPLPPPGLTLTLPVPDEIPEGTQLDLYRVDPFTSKLVPMPSVYGGNVRGTVIVIGAGYSSTLAPSSFGVSGMGTKVAKFDGDSMNSTMVGLVPLDTDNDLIPDTSDQCPATPSGTVVNTQGCAIVDLCPCDKPWKDHGAYVSCVVRTTTDFIKAGLLTTDQRSALVSKSAASICGSTQ